MSTSETPPPAPAPAPRARRWPFAVVGVAVLGAMIVFLRERQAGGAKPPPPERPTPVEVATVVKKDLPIYLEGLGNAAPLQRVIVKTQVDGRLDGVRFTEGQEVRKGDVLAQIDPRPFANLLRRAQATLAKDQAQLQGARVTLARSRLLLGQGLAPEQQVDDNTAQVAQLEAVLKSDESEIADARLKLDYARITSPIDGVTGIRQVDPGNIVHAADQDGIVVVTQMDPMAVVFSLPEDDLPRLSAALAGGKVPVDAYSRDGQKRLSTGELSVIDNEVNAQTATVRLKAVMPNKDRRLWPNELVKARVLVETRKDALIVPSTAVQRGPNGTFAYVVRPDDTVAMQPIEVAGTQGESSIVERGLEPEQRVVVEGQSQLRPGAKVAAHAAGAPPPDGGSAGQTPRGGGAGAPEPRGSAAP